MMGARDGGSPGRGTVTEADMVSLRRALVTDRRDGG